MDDLIDRLRRHSRGVTPQEPAYERMLQRRDRKRRNSQIASIVTAFVVFGAGAAVAATAFLGHRAAPGRQVGGFASGGDSQQSNLVAGPGQYYYWKTDRVLAGPDVVEETWWGADGSGRYRVDQANPDYGVMNGETWSPDAFPGVFPFETDLSKLSTDPEVLGGQLADRSAPGGQSPQPQVTIGPEVSMESSDLWRAATQLLQMGNATPSLRVALYDVISQIPETTDGREQDPTGRPAVTITLGLGAYYGGGAQTLYFDPQTHLLLAMAGGQDGTIVVLDDGIVNGTASTPAGDERFFPAASAPSER